MKPNRSAIVLLAGAIPFFAPAVVSAANLPYNVQAALIVKMLQQDNNVSKIISENTVMVGVLCDGSEKAQTAADAMVRELEKLKAKGTKVKDYSLDCCKITLPEKQEIAAVLKAQKVNAVYVIIEKDSPLPDILKATQSLKALSIVGEDAKNRVMNKGVSVGWEVNEGKPAVYINPQSTVKEGRDFPLQFLSVLKVGAKTEGK